MKLKILSILLVLVISGCNAHLQGVSVGGVYMNTSVDMPYGEAEISEVMPVFMVNIGFD